MKITKFPQSCLVLEKGGRQLVIDPGSITLAKYKFSQLGDHIEAVLYTHQHPDHYESSIVDQLMEKGIELYGNADVGALIGPGAHIVQDGEEFSVAGFRLRPVDLPHCLMKDGTPGPPNTGFVIDGHLFHPGDGIELSGLQVRNSAIPIAGPTIDLGRAEAFADSLKAERVIPIHYDVFAADPDEFKRRLGGQRVVVLADGESVELA